MKKAKFSESCRTKKGDGQSRIFVRQTVVAPGFFRQNLQCRVWELNKRWNIVICGKFASHFAWRPVSSWQDATWILLYVTRLLSFSTWHGLKPDHAKRYNPLLNWLDQRQLKPKCSIRILRIWLENPKVWSGTWTWDANFNTRLWMKTKSRHFLYPVSFQLTQ